MTREALLTASAAVVVVAALIAAAAVPGALSPPRDEEPPGRIDIADMTIEPGTVSGETATLRVEAFLRHAGGPSENVTVRFRAVDSDSGLLETTRSVDLGTLDDEGETPVAANLSVEREGGYRIEVLVYQNGQRVEQGGRTVEGLDALTPAYARTPVGFADADSVQPVSVSVVSAGEERTELALGAWLTNRGDDPAGDLRVTFVLRQAESNLQAARTDAAVGTIAPGRTETAEATVSVPAGYNYYIDAVLWKEGVIVDTARSVVNLDPEERITVNETTREVELDVSDFERGGADEPAREQTEAASGASGPGFGAPLAVVALLAVALLARRWDR